MIKALRQYKIYWIGKLWLVMLLLKIAVLERFILRRYMDRSQPLLINSDRITPKLMMMYEPRFHRVVQELNSRGVGIEFLSRRFFDLTFRRYLWEYIAESDRNYGEYALSTYARFSKQRAQYKNCCIKFVSSMAKHFPTRVLLLPKYNDDYTLELIEAFSTQGWRVIVYDREGTVTPERLREIAPIVSVSAPYCDSIIVYNSMHRLFFERVFALSGATKVPRITVLGNPTSDDWFNFVSHPTGLWNDSRKKILFFAFGLFSYVYGRNYLKGKVEVWGDFLAELHDILEQYIGRENDSVLMYKRGPKFNRDYWPGSEALLLCKNVILPEVSVNSNQLIFEADVIVAFQTTALIDAMHTNKPIIYCAWGDRYEELREELIDFESFAKTGAIVHADSPAKLLYYLSKPSDGFYIDMESRKAARETFTHNFDGKLHVRCANYIVENL